MQAISDVTPTAPIILKYDWRRPSNLLLNFMLFGWASMDIGFITSSRTPGGLLVGSLGALPPLIFAIWLHSHRLVLSSNSLTLTRLFYKRSVSMSDLRRVYVTQEPRGKGFVVPVLHFAGTCSALSPLRFDAYLFDDDALVQLIGAITRLWPVAQCFDEKDLVGFGK